MTSGERGAGSLRPAMVVWLFVSALTSLPYLRAWLYPPQGRAFVGFFYSLPDVYNYLSYVQQAEDGAFLFVNKLTIPEHAPALANLEWWSVGRLSALLGHHPTLAYRVFGLLVSLILVLVVDRWLALGGVAASHRLAALLLVFTGGGLGGVLFKLFGPPAWRFLDLTTGLFPFISILVNPHFVAGTALLLLALLAFHRLPGGRGQTAGVVLGSALALVRPYDVVLLVGIRILVVFRLEPRERWLAALAPLIGLAPAAGYNYWVFYRNPAFAVLSGFPYTFPPLGTVALALAPALLLAGVAWWPVRARRGEATHAAQLHFVAWATTGLVFLFQPVSFAQQCLTNFGVPLLALAAFGFSRWRPAVALAVAAAFFSTGLVALSLLLEDNPGWFVPAVQLATAQALRPRCQPGDVALSPPDMGLYVNAYSACKAWVSHGVMADYATRVEATRWFYAPASAAARSAFLDREGIALLVLPGDGGPVPAEWLGADTAFLRVAQVGRAPFDASLYSRERRLISPSPQP